MFIAVFISAETMLLSMGELVDSKLPVILVTKVESILTQTGVAILYTVMASESSMTCTNRYKLNESELAPAGS